KRPERYVNPFGVCASGPATKSCKKFSRSYILEVEPFSTIGGCPMRGRKPRPLTFSSADLPIVQAAAQNRRLAWFQVQHARIVLAVANGEPIQSVAARMVCDPATVWRVCRRYEQGGLAKLLVDDLRGGRPQEISPPAARPDRRTGVF